MATYTSYDEVGVKEDVSDIITNLSPTKTPFLSSLRTEKITQKKHDWQEDALAAAADNKQVEGFDATDATLAATTLRSNYTQILSKTIKVSGTSDAQDAHGRAKESAYQMSKKMQEAKRDLEFSLIGVDRASAVGTSSVARNMESAPHQLDSSVIVTLSTAGPLTEADTLTVLEDLYTAGGEASVMMIKPADSKIVAGWADATGRERVLNDGQTRLTNVVNVYDTPYGSVKCVMNRFQLSSIAFFYDPSYWRLLVLRNWFREVLAKTGDSMKQMVVGEFSLKHTNQKASGAIKNLT